MGMGGALQQGYNPQGMYNVVYNPETASFENIGFTPLTDLLFNPP